ncbi:MAG: hypothetical protein GWO24_20680 [Akkermansiaceae bacterium]|nr:hypothetical protein [Akkermansiaceae bacterium]
MTPQFPYSDDQFRQPAPAINDSPITSQIAEFLVLQECGKLCEELAADLAGRERTHPTLPQLSECISACENYLAAKSRKSCYQRQISTFCMEVLQITSEDCRNLEGEIAERCGMLCRIGAELLARKVRTRPSPWN